MSAALDAPQLRAYQALQQGATFTDRSSRMRMSFTGEKAKEALGGLLTNDVATLTAGRGQRAAALTPKGRVIALLRVLDRGADVLVDADPAAGAGFTAMIRKFVNPRLARHAELTAATGCIGVYGPTSAEVVARVLGIAPEALRELPAQHGIMLPDDITVIRSTDLGPVGFDVIASVPRSEAMRSALLAADVPMMDDAVAELARIEAGVPRWGVEMDDETIPQEANLDALGAISFNKGCYTGQEVVARIHFRGHVNRHLRWLRSEQPLTPGAVVRDMDAKDVGSVRSAAHSPARGHLAMAMVRREVAAGNEVQVVSDEQRAVIARSEAITAAG